MILEREKIITDTGVIQESVLSHILFDLFINNLFTNGQNQNVARIRRRHCI